MENTDVEQTMKNGAQRPSNVEEKTLVLFCVSWESWMVARRGEMLTFESPLRC